MKNNLWIFAWVVLGVICGENSYGNGKESPLQKDPKVSQTLQKRYQSVLNAWSSLDKNDVPEERLRKMKEDSKLMRLFKKFINKKDHKKDVEEKIKEYIGFLKARIERKKNHSPNNSSDSNLKNNKESEKSHKKEIKNLEEKISNLEKIMGR